MLGFFPVPYVSVEDSNVFSEDGIGWKLLDSNKAGYFRRPDSISMEWVHQSEAIHRSGDNFRANCLPGVQEVLANHCILFNGVVVRDLLLTVGARTFPGRAMVHGCDPCWSRCATYRSANKHPGTYHIGIPGSARNRVRATVKTGAVGTHGARHEPLSSLRTFGRLSDLGKVRTHCWCPPSLRELHAANPAGVQFIDHR